MTDWIQIDISEFMTLVLGDEHPRVLVGRIVLERLPFTFQSKRQYLVWRDELSDGFQVDARDIVIVGSAATGRSLNPRTKFGVFGGKSDVDIAVVSSKHFDEAWQWFRRTSPNLLSLDEEGLRLFHRHREEYVFNGMIAANYFLGYLPFGQHWLHALASCERYLPSLLHGRKLRVRIYKDNEALRQAQMVSLAAYRKYLTAKHGLA